MRKFIQASFFALAIFALSCGQKNDFVQSDTGGFEYKYIERGDGKAIEVTDFIAYNVDYFNDDKLLISSSSDRGGMPIIFKYSEQMVSDTTPMLVAIKMLKEGDSVAFKFNADEFYKNSFGRPLPDTIEATSSILAYMKMENVIPEDSFSVYMEGIENKTMEKEIVVIDEYLAENDIEAQTTESGLRYVILEEGTGEGPETGDTVSVHYTGTLFDGTKFDSSLDRGDPIKFPLGQGNVIAGWDEGIALLNKNAKAKFFIPSKLGYGSRGAGGAIPPNSILIFEVELVDY